MRTRKGRWRLAGVTLAGMTLGGSAVLGGGCTVDTQTSLADLAATTVGNFVQIVLKGYFDNQIGKANPDPNIPISQQSH